MRRDAAGVGTAWRRERAGGYRSADDRFVVESQGAGQWFVRDETELDELGLPRVTGPFATLATAKQAADERRGRPAETSPLQAQLAAPREQRSGSRAKQERAAPRTPVDAAPPSRPRPSAHAPSQAPATWLDRLAAEDPVRARTARATIRALEATGMAEADDIVRRDLLGGRPDIATRLLVEALRDALREVRTAPPGIGGDGSVGLSVLRAVLEVIDGTPAATSGGARLPGWALVEWQDGRPGRRIHVSIDDIGGTGDDRA